MTPIEHGGTDAGPPPRVDASTNANAYGPSPAALAALAAEIGPYPDPAATTTRAALAVRHGSDAEEVVVGAGATELIDRLVRTVGGPVLVEDVTFGEYAGAADRHDVAVRRADRAGFAGAVVGAALAFVCSPGNPDGTIRSAPWCGAVAAAAAEAGTTLVWDLAYAPMVPEEVPVPSGAVALHAPNKVHGCTGLRAGWLHAPSELAQRLREAAVTWSVSTPGLAFLAATATGEAAAWEAEQRALLRSDRDALAAALRGLDLDVVHGEAPFVLARAPEGWTSRSLADALREEHGLRVRPTDSMGRPGWLRIAALPAPQRAVLLDAVTGVLEEGQRRASGVERSGTRRAPASPPDARGPTGGVPEHGDGTQP